MKKALVMVLMLTGFMVSAQEDVQTTDTKNEVSLNFLDLVVAGTVNARYERHLENNQSLALEVSFLDTYGYYDAGYIDKTTGFSAQLAYRLYFSKRKDFSGFYFYPLAKIRTGSVTTNWGSYTYFDDVEGEVMYSDNYKYDIDGFGAGFGIGHKWVLADKFTLDLSAQIARNIGGDDDYYGSVEFRSGVNLGYRF